MSEICKHCDNVKTIKEYEVFERVNGGGCPNMNWDNLITKQCKSCGDNFPIDQDNCNQCRYKKGPKKGELIELFTRKSKAHFCSRNRKSFRKIKKEV